MNTHHNIHLIKTKTDLKVTYRDGRFLQIKKLRGVLNAEMIKYIGYVIPPEEKDLDAFIKLNKEKVIYTSEAPKEQTLFSQFNSAWFAFFIKENQGRKPKFTKADGGSLKQIINYLITEEKGDEAAALSVWNFILNNWKHLPDFFKNNQDLKIINSKLNVIITALQKQHTSNQRTFSKASASEAARTFQFGKNNK